MNDVMINLEKCPDSWKRVTLGSICEVVGGFANPKEEASFKDGTIPFVRMQDLGRYHKTSNLTITKNKLNKEYVDVKKRRVIPKGSILIPRSGSVRWNHRAILGVDACIVSHICALIVKNESVDNLYLYYVLSNFNMEKIMKRTTGLDAITFEDLKRIVIPLAPIQLQRKIASVLLRADELMLKRKKSLEVIKQFTQSLFIKMFGDPIINSLKLKTKKLDEVIKIKGGGTPSTTNKNYWNGNIPWVSPKDMKSMFIYDTIDHITAKGLEESTTNMIEPGAVLVVNRSGILKKYLPIAINRKPVTINQDIKAFYVNKEITSEYLLFCLKLMSDKLLQKVRSVTADNIALDEFKNLVIPIPKIEQQNMFSRIVKKLESVESKIDHHTHLTNSLYLSLQRDTFYGKMMN